MYKGQSGLPTPEIHKNPVFNMVKVAEVTGNKDFDKKGVLYAKFTKGGRPCPVYVYEYGVNVKPEEGDSIIVGFLEGNKTTPYFLGFGDDAYACANFIKLHKDGIAVQFPLDAEDRKSHMSDSANVEKRAYIRIFNGSAVISYPGASGVNKIKLTASGVEIDLDADAKIDLGGTTPVARQGDTVQVNVPGVGTCTGTITGGSDKVTAG